jgi:DNA-binding winged helix-turn-helix (wHTH) protein
VEGKAIMAATKKTAPFPMSLAEPPQPQLQIVQNGKHHPNAPLMHSLETGLPDGEISLSKAINFGSFCVLPAQRLLFKDDEVIALGSRAMDILIALVERPGESVSKTELMARVWPNTFVEPANLTVHISALRRALGDGRDGNRFFINIPGRGYRFVAPVTVNDESESEPSHEANNLPATVTRMRGREDVAAELPLPPVNADSIKGLLRLAELLLSTSELCEVISGFDKAVGNSKDLVEQTRGARGHS